MTVGRTFYNYGIPFSSHIGTVSINNLPRAVQDELIRTTLSSTGDMHEFVMRRDILRSEAQGLWSVIVTIGSYLQELGFINDFLDRSSEDIDRIIRYLELFSVGRRIREAVDSDPEGSAPLDWARLRPFAKEGIFDECETLDEVAELLDEHLGEPSSPVLTQQPPPRPATPIQPDKVERAKRGIGIGWLQLGKKPVAAEVVGRNLTAHIIDADSCWADVCALRSYKPDGPVATCEMAFARAALTKFVLCESLHESVARRLTRAADELVLDSFTGQDTPATRSFYRSDLGAAAASRVTLYEANVFPHAQLAATLGAELGVPGHPAVEAAFMFQKVEERVRRLVRRVRII